MATAGPPGVLGILWLEISPQELEALLLRVAGPWALSRGRKRATISGVGGGDDGDRQHESGDHGRSEAVHDVPQKVRPYDSGFIRSYASKYVGCGEFFKFSTARDEPRG